MKVLAVGDAAVLAELDDGDPQPLSLALAVTRAAPAGVSDVVPAERSVLVRFDRSLTSPGEVARRLRGAVAEAGPAGTGEQVLIEVDYDGEDLAVAARLAGLSEDEVVAAHTAATWTVLFSGFAPGFGYLRCADRRLDVPRRDRSRTRVPAGSVALAAGYTGVYPRSSPGGWQLIGRTDADLWNLDRDPPALLRPGVQVRFTSR